MTTGLPSTLSWAASARLVGSVAVSLSLAFGSARGQTRRANAPATVHASTEARAVRAARAAQNRAIVAGDIDRIAEFWTDDVEIRRGLGQLVLGREAYRALFVPTGNRDSALVYQREPNSVDVSAHWPLAYESGTWTARVGRVDGPVVIRGRYSAQWVKRGNRWLIRGEVYVALTCSGVGCAATAAP